MSVPSIKASRAFGKVLIQLFVPVIISDYLENNPFKVVLATSSDFTLNFPGDLLNASSLAYFAKAVLKVQGLSNLQLLCCFSVHTESLC